jgi:hypothetical protein
VHCATTSMVGWSWPKVSFFLTMLVKMLVLFFPTLHLTNRKNNQGFSGVRARARVRVRVFSLNTKPSSRASCAWFVCSWQRFACMEATCRFCKL